MPIGIHDQQYAVSPSLFSWLSLEDVFLAFVERDGMTLDVSDVCEKFLSGHSVFDAVHSHWGSVNFESSGLLAPVGEISESLDHVWMPWDFVEVRSFSALHPLLFFWGLFFPLSQAACLDVSNPARHFDQILALFGSDMRAVIVMHAETVWTLQVNELSGPETVSGSKYQPKPFFEHLRPCECPDAVGPGIFVSRCEIVGHNRRKSEQEVGGDG